MGVSLPARWAPLLATLIATFMLWAGTAIALEGIAVVDFQMIFDRYEGTADAQRTLELEIKEWERQLKEMRSGIDELNDEIESQRLMLSEERLREKRDELQTQREEYESFSQQVFGVNGKAAQLQAELTSPIAEKILDVIAKIAKERNLKVILDVGTGGVIWAEDDVNVTDIVLDDLSLAVGGADRPAEGEGTQE